MQCDRLWFEKFKLNNSTLNVQLTQKEIVRKQKISIAQEPHLWQCCFSSAVLSKYYLDGQRFVQKVFNLQLQCCDFYTVQAISHFTTEPASILDIHHFWSIFLVSKSVSQTL